MALRIFQFSILFTIALLFDPAQSLTAAVTGGVKETSLSLNVTDPADVTAVKGQSASIRCDYALSGGAGRRDDVSVAWLHDDKPIAKTDARRTTNQDGTLFFPRVTSARLAGLYRCNVTLHRVGSLLSNAARLRIAAFDREFEAGPRDLAVPEKQPALLDCKIRSVPAASIEWERNNHSLPQSTRYVPLPSGSLLITETHSSDSGTFRCKATNTLLEKTRYSPYSELTVTVPLPNDNTERPAFLLPPTNETTQVKFGESTSLICAAKAWPTPTIKWYKYNANSSEAVSIETAKGAVYRITKANLNHNRKYRCEVSNAYGTISRQFDVIVLVAPHFNVTPTSLSYASPGTVRLTCQVLGNPPPSVTWLKNGRPLEFDGRLKKVDRGIIFSHTFTYDYGLYQCVGENEAGKVWSAAQLDLLGAQSTRKKLPRPPENLSCRPFDETSVCLDWDAPFNVTAQAYSTHSFLSVTDSSPLVAGPEFISNVSHQLAVGLMPDTDYTFYVRLYSKGASDDSNRVVCKTGIEGGRDLRLKVLNGSSVQVAWSPVSTDVPCGVTDGSRFYKVLWRRAGLSPVYAQDALEFSHTVHGLSSGVQYEFAVVSSNYSEDVHAWSAFRIPLVSENQSNKTDVEFGVSNSTKHVAPPPPPPDHLHGAVLSARAVNLTWTEPIVANVQYYTVCYVPVAQQHEPCLGGNNVTSEKNSAVITNLTPDTLYEFRVRSHNLKDLYGAFSRPVQLKTPVDVPSPILNLKYKVVNESAVCLYWQPPVHGSSKISKYVISYTPNPNRPLGQWLSVSVPPPNGTKSCWSDESSGGVSAYLLDLNVEENYTLFVRAISESGSGKPVAPIVVSTNKVYTSNMAGIEERDYNNFIGIAVGLALSVLCVVICLMFIWYRRKTIKRSRRLAARGGNNYCPAVAHYATQGSSVQVRLEDASELHETQHLVGEEPHLDTKGGEGFPNGHVNGVNKKHGANLNGHVHITENPQYRVADCNNGHVPTMGKNNTKEDDNSNFQTSKFRDLQRLFDKSKRQKCDPHFESAATRYNDSSPSNSVASLDGSPNGTQLTSYFDDSVSKRRASPILGPNG